MKPVFILAQGESLKSLKDNIQLFKDIDCIWSCITEYTLYADLLKEIDKRPTVMISTSWGRDKEPDFSYYRNQVNEFAKADPENVLITHKVIADLLDISCKVEIHKLAEGHNLTRNFNTLTALILIMITKGYQKFFLFGCDGGGKYYKDSERLPLEALQRNLTKDTKRMNETFWQEVETLHPQDIKIFNVSPKSRIKCFPKIGVKDAWNLAS